MRAGRTGFFVSVVHGLDVSDGGRWPKVAPLHAGANDAQYVVSSVVKAEKSSPFPRAERLLGLQYEVHFQTFFLHL